MTSRVIWGLFCFLFFAYFVPSESVEKILFFLCRTIQMKFQENYSLALFGFAASVKAEIKGIPIFELMTE